MTELYHRTEEGPAIMADGFTRCDTAYDDGRRGAWFSSTKAGTITTNKKGPWLVILVVPDKEAVRFEDRDANGHIGDTYFIPLEDEEEKTRDWTGVVLGCLFVAGGVWLGLLAFTSWSRWWVVFAGFSLLIGIVGLTQDGVARKRDERGRPI